MSDGSDVLEFYYHTAVNSYMYNNCCFVQTNLLFLVQPMASLKKNHSIKQTLSIFKRCILIVSNPKLFNKVI